MPPLKNVKHEQFANNLLKANSLTEAYKITKPNVQDNTAVSTASRLMTNNNIRERFFELLRENGSDLSSITRRYNEFLNDRKNVVQSWDAVKTGLKIYNVLDPEESNDSVANINISITNITT